MADPFIGEIRGFAFNFVPRGWIPCDGRLLSIAQNTTLFAILGTTYGGNGQTTFAVPNLIGQTMVSQGQGPGLQPWVLGEQQGTNTVTLIITEMPMHNHSADAKNISGNSLLANAPAVGSYLTRFAPGATGVAQAWNTPPNDAPVLMHPMMVQPAGGSMPHNNMQPQLALLFGVCSEGVFPARN